MNRVVEIWTGREWQAIDRVNMPFGQYVVRVTDSDAPIVKPTRPKVIKLELVPQTLKDS